MHFLKNVNLNLSINYGSITNIKYQLSFEGGSYQPPYIYERTHKTPRSAPKLTTPSASRYGTNGREYSEYVPNFIIS